MDFETLFFPLFTHHQYAQHATETHYVSDLFNK